MSALVFTWTSARRAVECLEFVRRRWVAYIPTDAMQTSTTTAMNTCTTSNRRWQPDAEDDIFCPICFEIIRERSSSRQTADQRVVAESCRLDCGHELHAVSTTHEKKSSLAADTFQHRYASYRFFLATSRRIVHAAMIHCERPHPALSLLRRQIQGEFVVFLL